MSAGVVITLDNGGQVRAGDSVRGEIRIDPDKDVVVDKIVVKLEWTSMGHGDTSSGKGAVVELPGCTLQRGVQKRVRFSIETPAAGPLSYRGVGYAIVWNARASLDIDWAIDPKGFDEVQLVASPAFVERHDDPSPQSFPWSSAGAALAALLLLGGGAGLIALALQQRVQQLGIVGGVIIAGTLVGCAVWGARAMRMRALGSPKLEMSSSRLLAGDRVEATLLLPSATPLEALSAELVGVETYVKTERRGKNSRRVTRSTDVVNRDLEYAVFPYGQQKRVNISFVVDAHHPPSFRLRNHRVLTTLRVRLGKGRFSRLEWEAPLWVRPQLERARLEAHGDEAVPPYSAAANPALATSDEDSRS